jgi:Xaa-Pro aminopeptidase
VSAELERLAAALRSHGLDAALLVTPPNVTYASGFEVPLPGGFPTEVVDWLPTCCVVRSDGTGVLIVPEDTPADSWLEVVTFDSLRHFEPSDPHGTWRSAVDAAVEGGGPVGTDAPLHDLLDATPALREARRIKSTREVELLRGAAAAADAAQRRLLELAPDGAGASEIELYAEIVAAAQRGAGTWAPVYGTLATGPRSAILETGGAVERRVEAGDVGLLDIGVRVGGYFSDCANTVVFGREATSEQRRYLDAARAACEAAIATLRPGARCTEPVDAIRLTLERFGLELAHYAGHQLGTSINEQPRLLPYSAETIEEGMVFAVEAGSYQGASGSIGARCEKIALVGPDGPELLSGFTWD